MNIGEVLRDLSFAKDKQEANQILSKSNRSSLGGISREVRHKLRLNPLYLYFSSWVRHHAIEETHIPILLQATERIRQIENNKHLYELDQAVRLVFQQKFQLTDVNSFQQALQLFPEEQQKNQVHPLVMLFKDVGEDQVKLRITQALEKISAEEREVVLSLATIVIMYCPDLDGCQVANILEIIAHIPEADRLSVISYAVPLMKDTKYNDSRSLILDVVISIPASEREVIFLLASPLLKESLRKAYILKAIYLFPAEKRVEALPFIDDLMKSKEYFSEKDVFQTFALVPEEERTTALLACITNVIRETFVYDTKDIPNSIVDVPARERSVTLYSISSLLKDIRGIYLRRFILSAIMQIPVEARATVVTNALLIPDQSINAYERADNLKISYLFYQKGKITASPDIFTLLKGESNIQGRKNILKIINEIPTENSASLLVLAIPLLQMEADQFKKAMILRVMNLFPVDELEKTVPSISSLVEKIAKSKKKERFYKDVMSIFSIYPQNQRAMLLSHFQEVQFKWPSIKVVQEFIPLSLVAKMALKDIVALSETLEIVPSQLLGKKASEIVLEIPDLPTISLNSILSYFDQIDEQRFKKGFTKEQLRVSLIELLQRIEKQESYTAIPSEEKKREVWYQILHNILAAALQKVEEKKESGELDHDNFESELINMAIASRACGTAWKNSAMSLYLVMADRIETVESGGFENQVLLWMGQYKEGIIEELVKKLNFNVGLGMSLHLRNHIVRTLLELGVSFSENTVSSYDEEDKLITENSVKKEMILEAFNEYVTAPKIFLYLASKALEAKNQELAFDELIALAENNFPKELQEINEKSEEWKLKYGNTERDRKLEEEREKIAILGGKDSSNRSLKQQMKVLLDGSTNEELVKKADVEIARLEKLSEYEVKAVGAARASQEIQSKKNELLTTFLKEKGFLIDSGPTLNGVRELFIQKGFFTTVRTENAESRSDI